MKPATLPRRWRSPRRSVIGAVALVAVAAGALAAAWRSRPAPPAPPPPPAAPDTALGTAPPPPPPAADDAAVPPIPADTCELPVGYRAPAVVGDPAALRALIASWLEADGPGADRPPIAARRGLLYVHRAMPVEDDVPATGEAMRACGTPATWLRSYLREHLRYASLACDGAVCCYPGGEFEPGGFVVFRPMQVDGEVAWVLDAWVEVDTDGVVASDAEAGLRYVRRALRRLAATRCHGQPDVLQ